MGPPYIFLSNKNKTYEGLFKLKYPLDEAPTSIFLAEPSKYAKKRVQQMFSGFLNNNKIKEHFISS